MKQVVQYIHDKISDRHKVASTTSSLKKIRSLYLGDPIIIPASKLPALIVTPLRTTGSVYTTSQDKVLTPVRVKYVQNMKDELGQVDDISGMQISALDLFTNMIPEANSYDPDSIVGIFRPIRTFTNSEGKIIGNWAGNWEVSHDITQSRNYVAFESYFDIIIETLIKNS